MKTSIIIPAYNAMRWLPETLASVDAQKCDSFEVVIIDDGSTDGTAAYIKKTWPRFVLIRTENRGVSAARDFGTETAKGEFILYLDADDILQTGTVERHVTMLESNPDVDIVYSNWQRIEENERNEFVRTDKIERTIEDVHHDPQVAFFTNMWCPTGAYLYRREFLKKVGGWKKWLPIIQDARFAWDCARAGARWKHNPHVGVFYRKHRTGSVSTNSSVAFLKDCLANTDDIRRIWQTEGSLQGDRRESVLNGYYFASRGLFERDKCAFEFAWSKLLEIDPDYVPNGRALGLLTGFLGYYRAESIAHYYRRLKQYLRDCRIS